MIQPVILSGGSGSRLWPLSRRHHPKQFLSLINDRSLLQNTIRRVSRQRDFAAPLIVTSAEHGHLAAVQAEEQGASAATILVEPMARDTALAVAASAAWIARTDPATAMLVMPAGLVVEPADALMAAVRLAVPAAGRGWIVAFGVPPSEPDTGYGYLEVGGKAVSDGVSQVRSYIVEPTLEAALRFVESGRHYWNSGVFLVRAGTLLEQMHKHAGDIADAAERSVAQGSTEGPFVHLAAGPLERLRSVPIGRALIQSSRRMAITPIPGLGWSNVASWRQLYELSPHDDCGNATFGDTMFAESDNNLAYMHDGRVLVALGVSDLVMVSMPDALLVAHRSFAPDLRPVVEMLHRERPGLVSSSPLLQAPWGHAEVLHSGSRHQVLSVSVKPGGSMPFQRHYHRAEHWVVVKGTARVTRDGEVLQLIEGESLVLPVGTLHRIENPGRLPLNLIEIQSGQYIAEDDEVPAEAAGAET